MTPFRDPGPLPVGGNYEIILADCPWKYHHAIAGNQKVEQHYRTMELADIQALPVAQCAAPDAALYLWATAPKLPEAMAVIAAWDFRYRTNMVWVKNGLGIGRWSRVNHELLLIAVRGNFAPPTAGTQPASVLDARRGRHSEKPAACYEMLERLWPDRAKLELFARHNRPGWRCWGNQVPDQPSKQIIMPQTPAAW